LLELLIKKAKGTREGVDEDCESGSHGLRRSACSGVTTSLGESEGSHMSDLRAPETWRWAARRRECVTAASGCERARALHARYGKDVNSRSKLLGSLDTVWAGCINSSGLW
jgi:hypothetical protein